MRDAARAAPPWSTGEYHLRYVYRKLGIHSRDELRVAVGRRSPA